VVAFEMPTDYLGKLQFSEDQAENEKMDRVYMMTLRYDYMYIFCEDFYTEIVN
jgi:hypothetical protein